jgi:hypothetical protein
MSASPFNPVATRSRPEYEISHLLPGEYVLRADQAGAAPWEGIVRVKANGILTVDLLMEREPGGTPADAWQKKSYGSTSANRLVHAAPRLAARLAGAGYVEGRAGRGAGHRFARLRRALAAS